MNSKLLCTFAVEDTYADLATHISNVYDLTHSKIFTFIGVGSDKIYLMYNVHGIVNMFDADTIIVHRKPYTNTIYTINALNVLIRVLNGGVMDKNYHVNWNDYKNSLLLVVNGELDITPIELKHVFIF